MKKTFSIVLLIFYLFSITEIKEVLKIHVLLEHYIEHKSENHEINPLNFIVLHYLSGSEKDADYNKDMKLPFKTHDLSCYTNFTIQDLPKTFEFSFPENTFLERENKNYHYSLHYTNNEVFTFYPPPKNI